MQTSGHQLLNPGSVIAGRYEVVRTLGSGGMGSVLAVIDRALDNETIALKLLYPHLARDKTSFARFRNEVLVARRLSHPQIVRLYDFGHAGNGYYFISMEYMAGGSLGQQIYQGRRELLPFHETLRILRDISLGIAHAHANGVVHRDLKPDNILMGERMEVKITDFGLARTLYVDKGFTDTGEAVGTPYYMAPEQLRGDKIDGRTDIYALGIIAYEMVVGRRPFFDESYLNLAAKHINEPIPDFATKESGIPSWFQEFVQTAAAKKPDDRYPNATEIAELLTDRLNGLDSNTKVRKMPAILSFYAGSKRRRRRGLKGLAINTVLAAVLFFSLFGAWTFIRNNNAALGFSAKVVNSLENSGFNVDGVKSALNVNFSRDPKEFLENIRKGDVQAVEIQLHGGVDPKLKSEDGVPALSVALKAKQLAIAMKLLENGADPRVPDSRGMTPLMYAVQEPDSTVAQKLLADAPNSALTADAEGKTPLIHATIARQLPTVQKLLQLIPQLDPSQVDARDKYGLSALSYAVRARDEGLVTIILGAKAKADVQDYELGKTPLFYAVEAEHAGIVRLLLASNAKPTIRNKAGKSAYDVASVKMRQLLSGSSSTSPIYSATGTPSAGTAPAPQAQPTRAGVTAMTRLRMNGDSTTRFDSTLGMFVLTQPIRNFGSESAKGINVAAQTDSGERVQMQGPSELKANETGQFSLHLKTSPSGDVRFFISCENCYR